MLSHLRRFGRNELSIKLEAFEGCKEIIVAIRMVDLQLASWYVKLQGLDTGQSLQFHPYHSFFGRTVHF